MSPEIRHRACRPRARPMRHRVNCNIEKRVKRVKMIVSNGLEPTHYYYTFSYKKSVTQVALNSSLSSLQSKLSRSIFWIFCKICFYVNTVSIKPRPGMAKRRKKNYDWPIQVHSMNHAYVTALFGTQKQGHSLTHTRTMQHHAKNTTGSLRSRARRRVNAPRFLPGPYLLNG